MTEEEKTPEIWTPPETIDANTQRMAWLLFLEWWKACLPGGGPDKKITEKTISSRYRDCLAAAKIVRKLE